VSLLYSSSNSGLCQLSKPRGSAHAARVLARHAAVDSEWRMGIRKIEEAYGVSARSMTFIAVAS